MGETKRDGSLSMGVVVNPTHADQEMELLRKNIKKSS